MRDYGILENYESLGTGIVEFALDDYASTVKSLCRYYDKLEKALYEYSRPMKHHQRVGDVCLSIYRRIKNLQEIEHFLHSEWVQQLTNLDVEYVFREVKANLKTKGYRVGLMGLIVTTDEKGVKVYATEKEGQYGKYTRYSVGVSSKDKDGNWVNGYIECKFKKGVSIPNKARIQINKAFFVASKGGEKSYTHLMIMDYKIIEGGETSAAQDADEFMKIPEGIDEDQPFL